MEFYQKVIDAWKEQYLEDPSVVAMFLMGSAARGDIQYGNDLDIQLVVKSDPEKYEKEYCEDVILVEIGAGTLDKCLAGLENNSMKAYMYLDAKTVFDKENVLSKLQDRSQDVLDNYHPSKDEIKKLKKWLEAARIKITTSKNANDQMKLGFNVSNILWKIMEGLYLINKMPVPASTTAFIKVKTLGKLPDNFDALWEKVLVGDLENRTESTIILIEFILSHFSIS